MSRMEFPVVIYDQSTFQSIHGSRPLDAMTALMQAPLHEEPVDDALGLQPLREAVADCLEALSAEDQFMLDATFCERVTIRALAERMGLHKSYTHRLVKRAEVRLRDVCITHATIQAYLGVAGAVTPTSVVVEVVVHSAA